MTNHLKTRMNIPSQTIVNKYIKKAAASTPLCPQVSNTFAVVQTHDGEWKPWITSWCVTGTSCKFI